MIRFRDIKRKARRALHDRMLVPALYYALPTSTPIPVNVRVHSKDASFAGKIASAGINGERLEVEPRIIFLTSEVPKPRNNAVVSVEPGEAYRITVVEPADDITVTVRTTRLLPSDAQFATLDVPA